VASETAQLREYAANHRWFVIGGVGALLAALVGYLQLRKGAAAPSINVTLPAGSGAPAGFGTSDVLGAYQAGSAATAAGAAPLVGLGQGGLDLASNSLAAESGTLQALGNTQASMGGSLAQLLAEWGQPPMGSTPAPAPAPTPTPAPAPTQQTVTLDGNPLDRLIDPNGGYPYTLVMPSSRTFVVLGQTSIKDPDSGAMAPAYVVAQDGRQYWLLARNAA
jgi:hypothetical protein